MLGNSGLQLIDTGSGQGIRQQDRLHPFPPGVVGLPVEGVRSRAGFRAQGQRLPNPGRRPGTVRAVGLVHHHDVADFQHAGLEGLHGIPQARCLHLHRGVGQMAHFGFPLARAHRLDQNRIVARRIQDQGQIPAGQTESAGRAAGRHTAHKHVLRQRNIRHPDPIPQQRAARHDAGGIHRQDGHPPVGGIALGQPANQRGLACAGRTGDPHQLGPPRMGQQGLQQCLETVRPTLHPGEGARQRPQVAVPQACRHVFRV